MQTHTAQYDSNMQMPESRGGVILREYWNNLRGKKPYPVESDINPEDIENIWDSCFLISIDPVTRRNGYRYSYLGRKLIEAYGDDIHNPEIITNLISTSGRENLRLVGNFDEVLRTQKPVVDEASFVNLKRVNVKYRVSLFPMGDKGLVTHILGCMCWRMY